MNRWTYRPTQEEMATFLGPWAGHHLKLIAETSGADAVKIVPADPHRAVMGGYQAQRCYIAPGVYRHDGGLVGAAAVFVTLPEERADEAMKLQPEPSSVIYVPGRSVTAVWALDHITPLDAQYLALVQALSIRLSGGTPSMDEKDLRIPLPGSTVAVPMPSTAGPFYSGANSREQYVALDLVTNSRFAYSDLLDMAGNPKPRAKQPDPLVSAASHVAGGLAWGR